MPNELPRPAMCKVGRAQEPITPQIGVSLAGYFHDRRAESVRDELFAKVMVIESGGTRLALVSLDLISVSAEVADSAKEIIKAESGIPPDHVLVCATHTHTGPELRDNAVVPACLQYVGLLPRRMADTVKRAAEAMVPATLRAGSAIVEGYSFNRLFRLKDGTEVFGRSAQAIAPAGPIDPQLQTLSAVDEKGNLIALAVNFALHPDVIGGGSANFISADWPGEIGRNIAAVYGKDVVTLHLQGTCGDINHAPHDPTNLPRGGPAKATQLGRALAGAAMLAMERAEPMTSIPLASTIETLAIPYYTRDAKLLAEVAALKKKAKLSPFESYLIERCESWPHDGKNADVPVQAMRIGDIGLIALPAEIFVRIGLDIKHWSPFRQTFAVELANARASTYVPTADQAERGAYGAKPILSRWLCSDAGRRMADAALVMLHKLHAAPADKRN
ncbi:MAG: hypothetical protein FJ291_14585 [Planctomycetes bacterium]|nr:hypothetical protein [Planctomycetota bacterium]